MTAAPPQAPPQRTGAGNAPAAAGGNQRAFDPEAYRMSLGDHLEELRKRLILGLLGFAAVAAVLLLFGNQVLLVFCRPLFTALQRQNINPQLYYTQLSEGFVVWFRIALLSAAALS